MPLDPNISLQVKPVEMASPDIAKTLLGYAQIKNLTAEADLRNLQMAQMGLKMRDVAAFSAPGGLADQLQALRQPQPASGMVNGRDLGQLPPGQAAQGLPRPQSDQGAWVPPASPTQTSYASEDLTTTGPTLPFGRQAIPQGNVAYTATPGQARALQPGYAPPLATAPPGAPSQAAAPASAPRTLSPEQQAEQAFQLTQDWSLRHPNAPEMVKPIVELNQALLAHRKGALEIEEKGLNVVAQGTAAINRLPEAERPAAWTQLRQIWVERGIPGAQTLPPQFSQQANDALAQTSVDQKTYNEQRQKDVQLAIDQHKALTERGKLGEVITIPGVGGKTTVVPKFQDTSGTGQLLPPLGSQQTIEAPSLEANKARTEFEGQVSQEHAADPRVKTFTEAQDAYRNLAGVDVTGKTGQVAFLTNYFRLLNPASPRDIPQGKVVSPEVLGTVPERFQRKVNELWTSGTPLTADDMKDLRTTADGIMQGYTQQYGQALTQARQRVREGTYGSNPETVIPDRRNPVTVQQGERLSKSQVQGLLQQTADRLGYGPDRVRVAEALLYGGEQTTGDPTAKSSAGALGLGQIMPVTGKGYGATEQDLVNPQKNIEVTLRHVDALMQKYPGRPDLVAAEYNSSPEAMKQAGGGVPHIKETEGHVGRTLSYLQANQPRPAAGGRAAPPAAPPAPAPVPSAAPPVAATAPPPTAAPPAPTARSTPAQDASYQRWQQARIQALEAQRQRLMQQQGGR